MSRAASIDIRLYSCCIISPFRQSSKGGLLVNHLVQWFSQRTKPPFSSRSFQPATVDDARRYVTVLVLTQAGWPLFLQIDFCAALESPGKVLEWIWWDPIVIWIKQDIILDIIGNVPDMYGIVWKPYAIQTAKSPFSQWTPCKSPKCPPRYHIRHGHCCTVYFPQKRVCHLQE